MSDIPGYLRTCLNTGKLLSLAILVSGGIVLQILVSITFSIFIYTCRNRLIDKNATFTYVCDLCFVSGMCLV